MNFSKAGELGRLTLPIIKGRGFHGKSAHHAVDWDGANCSSSRLRRDTATWTGLRNWARNHLAENTGRIWFWCGLVSSADWRWRINSGWIYHIKRSRCEWKSWRGWLLGCKAWLAVRRAFVALLWIKGDDTERVVHAKILSVWLFLLIAHLLCQTDQIHQREPLRSIKTYWICQKSTQNMWSFMNFSAG